MIFLVLLINIISVVYLLWNCYKELKYANVVFFYCLSALFFIAVPLCYDTWNLCFTTEGFYVDKLNDANFGWDYNALTLNSISKISVFGFLFNIVFIKAYRFVHHFPKKQIEIIDPKCFFPFKYYILSVLAGLFLFSLMYGFDLRRMGSSFLLDAEVNYPQLAVFKNLFLISATSGLLPALKQKRYFIFFAILIPFLLVAVMTASRVFSIIIPFLIIYYILCAHKKIRTKNVLMILGLGYLFVFVLTYLLRDSPLLMTYPLSRDDSMSNLYYAFEYADQLDTEGSNTLRLITTNPFFQMDADDITVKLADYRFSVGWGTLHPTVYGWAFIDLQWWGLLLGLFFGLLTGFTDNIRAALPRKYSYLLLPFQLCFVAVMVRGSVQFAYSNYIYIVVFFLFVYAYFRTKKRRGSLAMNNNALC